MGPLTQATGPVRSGAGVGVGMLRGAGEPFFSKFLDLEIDQDSTIVKFSFLPKRVGKPDRFRDLQISNLFIKQSMVLQKTFLN